MPSRGQASRITVSAAGDVRSLPSSPPMTLPLAEPFGPSISFEIRSIVPGSTTIPVQADNASAATLRLFQEAERQGFVFVATHTWDEGGSSFVSYHLCHRNTGGRISLTDVPPIVLDRTNPGSVLLNGQWRSDLAAVRNQRFGETLASVLRLTADTPPVRELPERRPERPATLPPARASERRFSPPASRTVEDAPAAMSFDSAPLTRTLLGQMNDTGFVMRALYSSDTQAVYQVYQTSVRQNGQQEPALQPVGRPIIITGNDYTSISRRDQRLSEEMAFRLSGSDFSWRRELVQFLAENRGTRHEIATLTRFSQRLSATALIQGQEIRFGDALEAALTSSLPGSSLSATQLHEIRLPLLHTLQRIEEEHPGYLASLSARSPDALPSFTLGLARRIFAERAAQSDVALFAPGMQIVGISNHEAMCSPDGIIALGERYGIRNTPSFTNVFLLRGAAHGRQGNPAPRFLEWTSIVGGNTTQPTLLWLHGHGNPNSICFSNGHGYGNDIRARELAEALIQRQGSTVELSHVRMVLDCCHGYDFGQTLIRELNTAAARSGKTIASFPVIVTGTHRGALGWVNTRDGVPTSGLTEILLSARSSAHRLTVGDFMAADGRNARTADDLAQRWSVLDTGRMNGNPGRVIHAQDPAVFGSRQMDTTGIIESVLTDLQDRGVELPGPRPAPRRSRAPLELSRRPDRTESVSAGERC